MLDPVNDLLTDEGFQTGLVFGLAAAAAVGVASVVARPVRPWAGLAFGAATLLALADRYGDDVRVPVTGGLVAGLALLAAGGLLAGGGHPAVRLAAAVPGAIVLARSTDLHDPGWAVPTIAVATVVGGVLAAECDRALGRRGLTPVLLAVSVLGVYATTPDTEHARVLAGVALAIALLGRPWPLASLGAAGSLVTAGLVSWTAVVDGIARPGAVVGGVACLGMLAIEPAVRWGLRARVSAPETTGGRGRGWLGRSPDLAEQALVGALHLGVVGVCSRVAGLRTSAAQAAAISAVAYVVAAAALTVAGARRPGRPQRPH